MSRTRTSLAAALLALALPVTGGLLWMLHADAWGLGGRSPVLSYDTAQYALAARELATHGRLATTFALPLELSRHAAPPWPLAVVQPGLVLIEAALFRITPPTLRVGPFVLAQLSRPDQREWLAVVVPLACFILTGLVLAVVASRLLRRHAPGLTEGRRLAAALTVGLAFYLDPEAQHFAAGGFTELPFTFGLLLAFAALVLGSAPRHALGFGLLLGVTGALRGNMLWFAPVFALAAAALAPPGRRARVAALVLLGYALPLAPWWLYKWRMFGSPAWDLSRFAIWDGVRGHTWFSLHHVPELPPLPGGLEAAGLLAAKTARNLPALLLDVTTGPRALWLGAIVAWLALSRPRRAATADEVAADAARRPLRAAAWAALAVLALSLVVAALGVPWLRYLFPARVVFEAAGLLASWALIARLLPAAASPGLRRAVCIAVGVLALGWGGLQTARGVREARAVSAERGVPGTLALLRTAVLMNREIPAGEAVMSNLGPILAWHARRPVVHLASSPDDLDACRRRLEFRHVLLVFRDAAAAWPEWREVVARPAEAPARPEWNVRRVRVWRTEDGFALIWLELGPPPARLAALP